MNMQLIDWGIVLITLAVSVGAAIWSKQYVKSVADFLAANRCAGRYMLCVSQGISGLGIGVVAIFQMYYVAGFTAQWWYLLTCAASLVLTLSGWVIYRYRETRALTVAQFFEIRYSKRFRVFAGIICWISGIVNFGIFPAIGGKFFLHFCGLPNYPVSVGSMEVDLVYAGIMIALLSISLFFVFLGGQITVMVTDFLQGTLTNVGFLIILAILFLTFDWSSAVETLAAAPSDASLLDPNHSGAHDGFNPGYFFIAAFTSFYVVLAWQGSQGYFCSGTSAHEQKMAGILGRWRDIVYQLLMMLLPIAAYVVLHSTAAHFTAISADAHQTIEQIDNKAIREQMIVPLVLARLLPVGAVGLFCAVMLAGMVSTYDTYLHSWGSIFIQDVVLPFRKKPFTPRQHIWLLRLSILFVAVFIFVFSLLYRQNEYILMFQVITGAMFVGGAGSVIIGGLYWKHGSTAGAWTAMIIGFTIAVGTLILRQMWPNYVYPWLESHAPSTIEALRFVLEGIADRVWFINWRVSADEFPFDSQWMFFFAMLLSICGYVTCSLVSAFVFRRPAFNLDRMLHRGEYAIKGDHTGEVDRPVTGLRAILPTSEFSLGDKFIYYSQLAWAVGWCIIIVAGTIYTQFFYVSEQSWANFWLIYTLISFVVVCVTTVWLLIGGFSDMRKMVIRLSLLKRDNRDMGMVVNHRNLTDELLKSDLTGDPIKP